LLRDIQIELKIVKASLTDQALSYQNQVGQLRDEIISIKRQVSQINSNTNDRVESLCDSTLKLDNDIAKYSETLLKKVQSVHDILKHFHDKGHNFSRTKTETPNIIPPVNTPRNPELHDGNEQTSTNARTPYNQKSDTVILGDSILKGIKEKGLCSDIRTACIRGARASDALSRVRHWNIDECKNVVIHVGGNDVSSKASLSTTCDDIIETVTSLQKQEIRVYLCTICPRSDVDVAHLNDEIRAICTSTNATLVYKSFVYGDGGVVKLLFHRDGIHLNETGSRTLVMAINQVLIIIPQKRSVYETHLSTRAIGTPRSARVIGMPRFTRANGGSDYKQIRESDRHMDRHHQLYGRIHCDNCGRNNHVTAQCRLTNDVINSRRLDYGWNQSPGRRDGKTKLYRHMHYSH
jgi:hypothetical protein